MNLVKSIAVLAAMGSLAACVTINIYFPAAAAEKAADKIIEDIWSLKPETQKPQEKPAIQSPSQQPDGGSK